MHARRSVRHLPLVLSVAALFALFSPIHAEAQGFISPSYGYNFGGDAGCLEAFDCDDKNWNFGLSGGALGSVVGFELEWLYIPKFLGEGGLDETKVTTLMGNFMLAPKFGFLQPYGLVGIGLMRTTLEGPFDEEGENQIGWDIGGGLMVWVHPNVGIKGDVRYYHSFEVSDLLDFDLNLDDNKLDFGRAAFGAVFKF